MNENEVFLKELLELCKKHGKYVIGTGRIDDESICIATGNDMFDIINGQYDEYAFAELDIDEGYKIFNSVGGKL